MIKGVKGSEGFITNIYYIYNIAKTFSFWMLFVNYLNINDIKVLN